ncbi:FAD-dependent oxidoreductase [bacterium]|nr:FAD-dependent oxidoreductase [bacterium]
MARPVIMSVDDDPQVLASIERDLRDRYADDYRILSAESGAEALEALIELQRRGTPVAMLLVDQRMPSMEGTELLEAVAPIVPDARKVLLTAYADTQAAIDAINRVGLDHYLMKPWDPPEDLLYPVLDDLLETWQATVAIPYEGIRVAGTTWSPGTHLVKDFLARSLIPYQFLDIERDPAGRSLVDGLGDVALPAVFFPDGSTLIAPDARELAGKVGLRTETSTEFFDLIVLGAGPAGLAAGVYGASEGLRTAVIERSAVGGQAGTSSRIENYLGFPNGISGAELARRAATQAQRLGAEILTATEAVGVRLEGSVKVVTLADGSEIPGRTLVIATGMTVRRLKVPGYERFEGAGVYYGAAASEVTTYRDQEVFVGGGATSAGQAAMMFSKYCSGVSLIVRGDSLEKGMSAYLIEQIAGTENIEVMLNTRITEVGGGDRVEWLSLSNTADGTEERRDASGIFVFVGAVPHTSVVDGVVERNQQGFILTGPDLSVDGARPAGWKPDRDPYLMETSVPGIFAAGDSRHGVVRRVASAVGQGSVVVSMVHQYLETV